MQGKDPQTLQVQTGGGKNTHQMRYLFAWSANTYVLNFGAEQEAI